MEAYKHQVQGTEALIKWNDPTEGRVLGGCFALFDEMGIGKTKQVIDAAQILYEKGEIDKVVVVAPVAVRSVWFDPELGELKKHHIHNSARVIEYHRKIRSWDTNGKDVGLFWLITNYDYIRRGHWLKPLMDSCDEKTLLVLDESSAVKNWKAFQTKACMKLRKRCGRVILLNGTPIAHSPNDMYSQGELLDPRILNCRTYYHFRAKYAIMGGFRKKQIVNWVNLKDLQRRFAPYVIRRLKKDCLDLPPKLPPVILTAELTEESWKRYKDMRDEMVAWLEGNPSMASQAIVKAIRLAQLTSGFLGGFENPDYTREVSHEKLDVFIAWLTNRLKEDPNLKLLVWCRFRAELARLHETLDNEKYHLGKITGGQKTEEREQAIALLDPRSTPNDKPVIVIGSPQAGGMGLNLAAAHNVVYVSNDHNLKTRIQSMDRVHRPGQIYPVSYFDIMAIGPEGQRTMDHIILKSIAKKQTIANWTTKAWIKELLED